MLKVRMGWEATPSPRFESGRSASDPIELSRWLSALSASDHASATSSACAIRLSMSQAPRSLHGRAPKGYMAALEGQVV